MRSGICPKCGSTGIRTAVSGLLAGKEQSSRGISVSRGLLFSSNDTADYVCLGCGYMERYLMPGKALNWIATHWAEVPVRIPEGYGAQDRVPEGFTPHGSGEGNR
jgi:hypothetical protein